jgi:hypothetical protein
MILNGSREELGKYVRDVADRMGLRDWSLRLDVEDDVTSTNHGYRGASGMMASCTVPHGRKTAFIAIDGTWHGWEPEELRTTVVHELLHIHTVPMLWATQNIKHVIGEGALWGMFDSSFDDAHESMVDAAASAWAETLPLPVKAKRKKKGTAE